MLAARSCLAAFLSAGVTVLVAAPLTPIATIPLAVEGRIDHFAVDVAGQRLFVAGLGNHSLEIIDLAAGRAQSLGNLRKPQGIAYLAAQHRVLVADGDLGMVAELDSQTLAEVRRIDGLPDADNLRYDRAGERLYVGYGDGAIRVLDARNNARLADIKLPAHPEGFALGDGDKRLYVNLPDAGVIAVVDTDRNAIVQSWPAEAKANFPLALDQADHRAYVGTRRPARILVYDSDTGGRVATVPIGGDVDDIYFDREANRLYAICGEGFIDVIQKQDRDHYAPEARIATRPGARTGLFVPELGRLYVAVPRRGSASAEIRVYAAAR